MNVKHVITGYDIFDLQILPDTTIYLNSLPSCDTYFKVIKRNKTEFLQTQVSQGRRIII